MKGIEAERAFKLFNARKFNASVISLEHRYYGNADSELNDLKYLSHEQALADIANFVQNYPTPKNTRWIAVGCSYAGSLAAWVRFKYPELIHAAISMSAPILAQIYFPGKHIYNIPFVANRFLAQIWLIMFIDENELYKYL